MESQSLVTISGWQYIIVVYSNWIWKQHMFNLLVKSIKHTTFNLKQSVFLNFVAFLQCLIFITCESS